MKKYPLFLLAVFLVLSACGGSQTLQISDPATPIEVTAGSEFQIVVESNPSTGYHWEVVGELDSDLVEFVSRDYAGAEPAMPGSGGLEVWTFKAVSAGEGQITLGYHPPSNEPTDPQQIVAFTVTVK